MLSQPQKFHGMFKTTSSKSTFGTAAKVCLFSLNPCLVKHYKIGRMDGVHINKHAKLLFCIEKDQSAAVRV